MDDDDDEDYELDMSTMNMSADIMALMGASEEEVAAAKAAQQAGASDWKPPEESGQQNSNKLADFTEEGANTLQIMADGGDLPDRRKDNDRAEDSSIDEEAEVATKKSKAVQLPIPIPMVTIARGIEKVDVKVDTKASTLLAELEDYDSEGSCSEESWDEASMWSWKDVDSDEELDTENISPNLLRLLGLKVPGQASASDNCSESWQAPAHAGLNNSRAIVTLPALGVMKTKDMEVKGAAPQKKGQRASADSNGDEDESYDSESSWDSDDEEYDYEECTDEEYAKTFSTMISANLLAIINPELAVQAQRASASASKIDWKAPSFCGLSNSKPIFTLKSKRASCQRDEPGTERQAHS
ncbi:unnamed protein product [Chrysoparadoxa australica]